MNRSSSKSGKSEVSKSIQNELKKIELSNKQKELVDVIKEHDITFIQGPAGTAKTYTACYAALDIFSKDKDNFYNKIIISKPIQESGEKLGFLPGDVSEKIYQYKLSYDNNFEKILGKFLYRAYPEIITFEPLAYMRGYNYDNAIMLLDEAQNCDLRQLHMFVTRMGKNSKVVVFGDVSQYDIKSDLVGLPIYAELCRGIDGVGNFEFNNADIVRNKILIEITEKYEKWKYDNKSRDKNMLKS